MDGNFGTIVRRFGISNGVVVPSPANIAVTEPPAALGARSSRGSLYILVEVLGGLPDPAYTIACLTKIIQEQYYQTSGSTTGAITAGLKAANEWLFEENLSAPREERGAAGVSCAVLRDGQLFLGQIGPALAYLLQADGLRYFPEGSPWLPQAIPSDAERAVWPPMGVRRVVDPLLYHAVVDAGDTLVLASAALARYAANSVIAEALIPGPVQAAGELEAIAQGRDVNALIVGLEPAEIAVLEEGGSDAAPYADWAEPEAKAPAGRTQAHPQRPALPDMGRAAVAVGERLRAAALAVVRSVRSILPARRPTAGGQAVRRAPSRPAHAARGNTQLIALLALLVPVLIAAIVLISRFQFERSRRAEVASLLQQAIEVQESVIDIAQPEGQRVALQEALSLIDQALQVSPEDQTAQGMRLQVMDKLDEASRVQRLYTLWELDNLGEDVAGSLKPARIIVHGTDIFVLDRAANRAYHRTLSPAGDTLEVPGPEGPLVAKGEQLGSITVGDLVDMVWMPAGGARQTSTLLIVERNGSALEWDASQGLSVLPVADSAAWRKPQAIGAFGGNLYLLDPQQNRIAKYLPTGEGYTDPPVDYLTSPGEVDLTGAVDMGIDGHIYTLLADGTIQKFLSGESQLFEVTGLDQPLANPVAMCVSGEDETEGYIYVADAGLARVVQFTKQGEFIRQFKAPEGAAQLDHVRGLYVDEATQRMYLASGSMLYMAPLAQTAPVVPTATPESAAGAGN